MLPLVAANTMLRHFLTDVMSEFHSVDQQNPNCVVLCDAKDQFMYERVNKAFRILRDLEKPILFSTGRS